MRTVRPSSVSAEPARELFLLAAAAGIVAGLVVAVSGASAASTPSAREASPTSHAQEAAALVATGQDARAVYHLRRHLERLPDDADARAMLAEAELRLGLFVASSQDVSRLLAARPDDPSALRLLALIQQATGHPADALATIQRLQALQASDLELDAQAARTLVALGRHAEADGALRSALAEMPDDAELLNLFGVNVLELGGATRLSEAREALARAVTLQPDSAPYWNNLGFVSERLGDLQAALSAYVEAEGLGGKPGYGRNRQRVEAVLLRR